MRLVGHPFAVDTALGVGIDPAQRTGHRALLDVRIVGIELLFDGLTVRRDLSADGLVSLLSRFINMPQWP